MKKLFLSAFIFSSSVVIAQPSLIWQHCTGGTDGDQSAYVAATHDHGYIIAGFASSIDGDVINNHGGDDAMLIRLDSNNNILWKKTYGGSLDDDATSIIETSDHGFVFVGGTESNDGDVSGNHGDNDIWVVKIDSVGNIQWQKTFGDSTYDAAMGIIQNSAGNCMVIGWESDTSWNADVCLLNLDPSGNLIWQHTYGGSDEDWAYQVIQTHDGGYMLSGFTYSVDGDVTMNHGDRDVWLIKTDSSGALQWQKTYGGSDDDYADNIIELSNGEFVFAATATSSDGDVLNSIVGPDYWVVKINSTGTILTQKNFGGSDGDEVYRMIRTSDSGFALTGMTYSTDVDVSNNHGDMDCWTLKLDSNLNKQWALCSGGSDEDLSYGICQLPDGDFVITGYTFSNNGNVSGNHGGGYEDIWTFRLSDHGNFIAENQDRIHFLLYPNPATDFLKIKFYANENTGEEIILTDLSGRKLKTETIRSKAGINLFSLDLRNIASGAYMLELKTENSVAVKSFIKK